MSLCINWDEVDIKFKYAAKDKDGSVWLYGVKPTVMYNGWYAESESIVRIPSEEARNSHLYWANTLTERPKIEETLSLVSEHYKEVLLHLINNQKLHIKNGDLVRLHKNTLLLESIIEDLNIK